METNAWPAHLAEELRLNLARDGGRRVMYGGNPYEDDLEPDGSSSNAATVVDQDCWSNGTA